MDVIAAKSAITCLIFWSYGRPATPASWARRILEVAIISIARVILAVLWTPRILRRIKRMFAIICHHKRELLMKLHMHYLKLCLNSLIAPFSASSVAGLMSFSLEMELPTSGRLASINL
jgi:hypothetical protein